MAKYRVIKAFNIAEVGDLFGPCKSGECYEFSTDTVTDNYHSVRYIQLSASELKRLVKAGFMVAAEPTKPTLKGATRRERAINELTRLIGVYTATKPATNEELVVTQNLNKLANHILGILTNKSNNV